MYGILLLGILVASGNALPFRLQEDIVLRDLLSRAAIIGCSSDPGEVLFMFDTSNGVNDGQFDEDKTFAAEASRFLSKDIKIYAEEYGSSTEDKGSFKIGEAQSGLKKVSGKVGGARNVVKAIEEAKKKMTGTGKKVLVLFVDGDLSDKAEAESAVAALGGVAVYVAVPKGKYHQLKDQVSGLTKDRLMYTKDMVLAEYFQMDLNVVYGGC